MWNERYAEPDFAYGIKPNDYLVQELEKLKLGKILFVCEGEGRNAVYAATKGWHVEAFDASAEGFKKAQTLSTQKNVKLNYQISDAVQIEYEENSFDAIALIYAHFPVLIRTQVHHKLLNWLKPGGIIIIEGFNHKQLQNTSGGPKDINMLYTKEILSSDFETLNIILLSYEEIILNEGKYHQGKADVCRLIAQKK